MKNIKYLEAVENLVQAVNIAINVFKEYPPQEFNEIQLNHVINVYSEWRDNIINPKPQFANITSLKYSIEAVFTYFQEGKGLPVEIFWKRIKEVELPYKRENRLKKILKRKKIKDEIEYDFIIDIIVPYQQEGFIDKEEVMLLNKWIADFEKKKE